MTPKQHQLLTFIRVYVAEHGYPPSHEEMVVAVNLKSKSSVSRRLSSLREQGKVKMDSTRYRSLELVPEPTANSIHDLVGRLVEEQGPEHAAAVLIGIARDLVPAMRNGAA